MQCKETITQGIGEETMVNDTYVEMIKRDINEAIQTPSITFDQVHYMIRQNIEKLMLYDKKKYGDQITKYYEKEQELNNRIQKSIDEVNELKKQLAANDEKIYEAIKEL